MHLIAIPVIAVALVAFAFGKDAARVAAGLVLGMGAAVVLLIVGIAAIDIARQERAAQVIHMGHSR